MRIMLGEEKAMKCRTKKLNVSKHILLIYFNIPMDNFKIYDLFSQI